jgi:hypothetical protein|tara:strand:+ start:113 stop:433 length:321 start_codon:yes stop_codon:yes gene_type:complete
MAMKKDRMKKKKKAGQSQTSAKAKEAARLSVKNDPNRDRAYFDKEGRFIPASESMRPDIRTVDGITFDTDPKFMFPDEYDRKYGGKVKRRMGGMIKKGYGKAMRGY